MVLVYRPTLQRVIDDLTEEQVGSIIEKAKQILNIIECKDDGEEEPERNTDE